MNTGFTADKTKLKILLTEGIHREAVDQFIEDGYAQVDHLTHALNEDELLEIIDQYTFIGVRSRTHLTEKVLKKAHRLIAIGCFCIGTNQVDLDAATKFGIPVFNAPYENTRSVAEYTICSIIGLMRGLFAKNLAAHRGEWHKSPAGAHEVRGKTLGIIGYGNIGSQVGVLAESLGLRVIYYNPSPKLPMGNATPVRSLKELLQTADVVSLHVPQKPETEAMIGAKELAIMKQGSFLINAARGKVVVIEALKDALEQGHISGAALDVFPTEPKSKSEAFESPLRGMDNVMLSPHIGGNTVEAQANIGRTVSHKLLAYSNTGNTSTSYNMPQVQLPAVHKNAHRLLHIHENKPGVLRSINDILSDGKVNIEGQYLQTRGETGYVVVDISENAKSKEIIKTLKKLPGTIRARLLY